jgi:HEAT repeat protein
MRTRLPGLLLLVGCTAWLAMPARAETTATKTDIAKIVAQAATYQPGQSREPFRRLEELVRESPPGSYGQLEAELMLLLAPGAAAEAREFACTQLGIIGSKKALPALAKLLKSDETAGIACLALTTYPPGKADEILRAALSSAEGTARLQIINTLGDRRDAKAVKLLEPVVRNFDTAVATAAIASLGKIGNEAAWKAIAAFSKEADPALRPALTEAALRCAENLVRWDAPIAAKPIYEDLLVPSQPAYVRRAALAALLRLDKDQAQQRILQVLRGSDAALKPVAIADIRLLPSGNASEIFAAELPKLSPQEQVWMIDSLAARGDMAACTAIGNSLGSPDAAVRRAAIDTLGRVGGSWCVPLFARALPRAQNAEEHRALESALIGLRGGAITDRVITTTLKKSSGDTRADLITALARRQGPAANALLLDEAAQPDPAVAKAALRALAKTAEAKDANELLQRLTATRDAGVRAEAVSAAAHALAQIDKPSRRSELACQALRWPQSAESHIAVLGLLPACGNAAALAALDAAAADSETTVREAAVRALAEWPDGAAWGTLAGVYRQPGREVLREVALRGLVRLAGEMNAHADARLIERYRQLIDDAHTDADLRLILGALGGAAQPGALELALPLLENPAVRAEAEVTVKRIAEAIKPQHPQAAAAALKRVQPTAKAQ